MEINSNTAFLQHSEFGIVIGADLHPQQPQQILLRGRFRVPYGENGIPEQGVQTLKHVILVVTRAGNYQSLSPFAEVVVFEDDVRDEGQSCSAFFNIAVMNHIQFSGAGEYHILCSIGTYTSNIVKVVVNQA